MAMLLHESTRSLAEFLDTGSDISKDTIRVYRGDDATKLFALLTR